MLVTAEGRVIVSGVDEVKRAGQAITEIKGFKPQECFHPGAQHELNQDTFELGCILMDMLIRPPEELNPYDKTTGVIDWELFNQRCMKRKISSEAKKFFESVLFNSPTHRRSLKVALEFKFLAGAQEKRLHFDDGTISDIYESRLSVFKNFGYPSSAFVAAVNENETIKMLEKKFAKAQQKIEAMESSCESHCDELDELKREKKARVPLPKKRKFSSKSSDDEELQQRLKHHALEDMDLLQYGDVDDAIKHDQVSSPYYRVEPNATRAVLPDESEGTSSGFETGTDSDAPDGESEAENIVEIPEILKKVKDVAAIHIHSTALSTIEKEEVKNLFILPNSFLKQLTVQYFANVLNTYSHQK